MKTIVCMILLWKGKPSQMWLSVTRNNDHGTKICGNFIPMKLEKLSTWCNSPNLFQIHCWHMLQFHIYSLQLITKIWFALHVTKCVTCYNDLSSRTICMEMFETADCGTKWFGPIFWGLTIRKMWCHKTSQISDWSCLTQPNLVPVLPICNVSNQIGRASCRERVLLMV